MKALIEISRRSPFQVSQGRKSQHSNNRVIIYIYLADTKHSESPGPESHGPKQSRNKPQSSAEEQPESQGNGELLRLWMLEEREDELELDERDDNSSDEEVEKE